MPARLDPITFEVFKHRFVSIAEEMGVTLCRTGFSPNIKERLDYSCAIYDAQGATIAQGDHMPVHLGMTPGSMPLARELYQEGLIIPPVRLVRGGALDRDVLALLLANVRTPQERE